MFQTLDIVHILKALGVAFESSGKPLKYGTRILTKAVPTPTPDDPTKTTEYVMVKDELIHDYQAEQDASTEGREYIGIQTPLIHKLSIDNFNMSAWLRMNVGLQMKVMSATVARYYATKNPALAWFLQACNDKMDMFNAQVGRTQAVKLGAIGMYNLMPLECLEKIFGQFLDWKAETRDIGDPLKFLAATTYSNLRQCLLGFIAMCRHYLDKFPGVKIPHSGELTTTRSSTTFETCAVLLVTTPLQQSKSAVQPRAMQLLSGSLVTRLEITGVLLLVPMPMTWISMSGHMPLL